MRKYFPDSLDLLKEKINKKFVDDDGDLDINSNLSDRMIRELKVEFDWENVEIEKSGNKFVYCGYHSFADFDFFGVSAGGDWQYPTFFLFYLDHNKELRIFTPGDGQVWDKLNCKPYDNDECPYETDWKLIKECIINRFGITTYPFSTYEDKLNALEELKFYHPNNETGELFQSYTHLAKQLASYGSDVEFNYMLNSAKKMAEDSAVFCIENFGKLDEDFITGLG